MTALNFVCLHFPSECFLPRLVRPLLGTKQTMRSHIMPGNNPANNGNESSSRFNFPSDKWYFFRLSTAKNDSYCILFFNSFCLWGGDREGLPYPRKLNQSINKVTVLCITSGTLKNELIFHQLQVTKLQFWNKLVKIEKIEFFYLAYCHF